MGLSGRGSYEDPLPASTLAALERLRRQRIGAMAIVDRSAAEAAQRIAEVLEAAHVPYAIGGALALAIAGVPRGTADVDVNVFISEERLAEIFALLETLGVEVDIPGAAARAHKDGRFVARRPP